MHKFRSNRKVSELYVHPRDKKMPKEQATQSPFLSVNIIATLELATFKHKHSSSNKLKARQIYGRSRMHRLKYATVYKENCVDTKEQAAQAIATNDKQ